jgi:hypothetical protein
MFVTPFNLISFQYIMSYLHFDYHGPCSVRYVFCVYASERRRPMGGWQVDVVGASRAFFSPTPQPRQPSFCPLVCVII